MKHAVMPLAVLAFAAQGCIKASAKEDATDRQVELTVYSQDFAQVTETRPVDLNTGTTRIGFEDVSHMLDESTVLYDFPTSENAQVVATTYDLGTQNGQALLEQLVGKEVALVYRGENGKEGERQVGILEVASPGNVVVRVGDKLIVNPNATIESNAGEVATRPRLTASVESKDRGTSPMNVSYMTRGISWNASYVLNLDPNSNDVELECWATVTNNTGIDFPAAKIKFVAGSPNRSVVATNMPQLGGAGAVAEEMAWDRGFEDKSLARRQRTDYIGELVAYPYESKATLKNNQTNRVLMMQAQSVKVHRDYAINLNQYNRYDSDRIKATLSIALKNNDESGLGQPLPMGTVRVYEPVAKGAPEFIGSAAIGNTPKDDRIDLTLTEVFNVYARNKTVKATQLDKRRWQYVMEVEVFNEKDRAVDVRLVRDFYGKWTITNESIKSTRPVASQAQWIVTVPAGGSQKLNYTVVVG